MRLFQILLIIIAVWIFIRLARQWKQKAVASGNRDKARIGTMVRCANCGLHIPESEALQDEDEFYCSQAHRIAGKN